MGNNFITGSPYFVVSIGLAFQDEIILGVVYNPISDELFYAEKGKGACFRMEFPRKRLLALYEQGNRTKPVSEDK